MSARIVIALVLLGIASQAHAEPPRNGPPMGGMDAWPVPRTTLVPGRPGMAGGFHFMLNAYGFAQTQGLGAHRIENAGVDSHPGGRVEPVVSGDWAMGYFRDAEGWLEVELMLNLEALTLGNAGVAELGQAGEGMWDAQHPHLFLHQLMLAFHPLAGTRLGKTWMGHEPDADLSIFAGQGSATIGPPVFMHRMSAPGPSVPRKHHKGENPHETAPVLGASFRYDGTWIEASVFGAQELTPTDSRWRPYLAAPESFALRVRQDLADAIELQLSGERLAAQGRDHAETQLSASATGWWHVEGWRIDALVDWAIDVPDGGHDPAQAVLAEVAIRSPNRFDVFWLRTELDQRGEADESVSGLWAFQTIGFEHNLWGCPREGLHLAIFSEATFASIPRALEDRYGQGEAVSFAFGLHLFGMWMLDETFQPMGM